MTAKDDVMQRRARLAARRSKLSPQQQELFEKQLQGESGKKTGVISRRLQSGPAPLSLNQQRLWFLCQLEPNSVAYTLSSAARFSGWIDLAVLDKSFNEVVSRHDILRTTFTTINGQPMQVIAPSWPMGMLVVDLRQVRPSVREAEAWRATMEETHCPFNLTTGPLVRFVLLLLDEEDLVMLLTMHHIISDGWSAAVFIDEMLTLYYGYTTGHPSSLPELSVQYADFAVWQRGWLQGETLQTQLAYWRKRLARTPPLLALPTDRLRPPVQTFLGKSLPFRLDPDLTQRLKALSQQSGTTLFMTLEAAFAVLLSRYCDQATVVVGTPISNRHHRELEPLIGCFVNTLALCNDLSGNPTFLDFLVRVRRMALEAYDYQDLPFEMLVQELQPDRDPSHNLVFQVMFLLGGMVGKQPHVVGVQPSAWEAENDVALFDLILGLDDQGESIHATFTYNTDLFDRRTIEQMVVQLQTLLAGIVADPTQRVAHLPLLTESERRQRGEPRLAGAWPRPLGQSTLQWFEAEVEQQSDAIALSVPGQQLTYRELNRRANQVAHYVQRWASVSPEPVGLELEEPVLAVIGLLGLLKAGRGVAMATPRQAAQEIQPNRVRRYLTQEQCVERVAGVDVEAVCLDRDWLRIAQESGDNLGYQVTGDPVALVVYSTTLAGVPAVVRVSQAGLGRLVEAQREALNVAHGQRVFQCTCLSATWTLPGILTVLLGGATLCLSQASASRPTPALASWLEDEAVTTLLLPTGWLADLSPESLSRVDTLLTVGEPCPPPLLARWRNVQIYHIYGGLAACLVTVVSPRTVYSQRPLIGRPVGSQSVYVLDKFMQPVPVGVPGELYLASEAAAGGDLEEDEGMAEEDIHLSWSISSVDGERLGLYKTGDLGRQQADGMIEFMGRVEPKVEIRGRRVEVGQIEAVLGQHPAVRETVVMAHESLTSQDGSSEEVKRALVAYVVLDRAETVSISGLRGFLKDRLPGYLVPAEWVILDVLPLTHDGIIDRALLPRPDRDGPASVPGTAEEMGHSRVEDEVALRRGQLSERETKLSVAKRALLAKRLQTRNVKT